MRGKILVVDDDPDVRDLLSKFLILKGFEVFEASRGEKGLEVARSQKPDLIILDMMMPGISGLEILKALKKESPQTPVLVLSAVDEEKKAREAIQLGAYDYVVKPIQLEEFSSNFLNRLFD